MGSFYEGNKLDASIQLKGRKDSVSLAAGNGYGSCTCWPGI